MLTSFISCGVGVWPLEGVGDTLFDIGRSVGLRGWDVKFGGGVLWRGIVDALTCCFDDVGSGGGVKVRVVITVAVEGGGRWRRSKGGVEWRGSTDNSSTGSFVCNGKKWMDHWSNNGFID